MVVPVDLIGASGCVPSKMASLLAFEFMKRPAGSVAISSPFQSNFRGRIEMRISSCGSEGCELTL
jgi:hypothetical protein